MRPLLHAGLRGPWRALLALLVVLACLTGCATPTRAPQAAGEDANHWQGKLALTVYSQPVQSLAAHFDLQGHPGAGELLLTSPLGTTLARMQWDGESATLEARGERRQFRSLQELVLQATGTTLPLAGLFAWLQGRDEPVPGWQVELGGLPQGRILARRTEGVEAELKIILAQ